MAKFGERSWLRRKVTEVRAAFQEGFREKQKPQEPQPKVIEVDPGNPYEKQAALQAKYPQGFSEGAAPPVTFVTRAPGGGTRFIERSRETNEIVAETEAKEQRRRR